VSDDQISKHGPAMTVRRTDKGYPFGDKVPKRVRTTRMVSPDAFCGVPISDCESVKGGRVVDAWTNSFGAVSAITPTGHLGLYPDEFEVVEWFDFGAGQ
jgi:hypothetical protein